MSSLRNSQDRQCLCKYYEETLSKVKEENNRYVEKMKYKHECELSEYRSNYDSLKLKIALDINEKTLSHIKERHAAYFNSYC